MARRGGAYPADVPEIHQGSFEQRNVPLRMAGGRQSRLHRLGNLRGSEGEAPLRGMGLTMGNAKESSEFGVRSSESPFRIPHSTLRTSKDLRTIRVGHTPDMDDA